MASPAKTFRTSLQGFRLLWASISLHPALRKSCIYAPEHYGVLRPVDSPLRLGKSILSSAAQKGKGHWAAVRALAYRWIRIIFACWKNKVVYDDARYMQSLRKSKSPLISLMEEAAETAIAN
jgi:hypothetical protein